MDEEDGAMELDMDTPLAHALKRKRKAIQKKRKPPGPIGKTPEAAHDPDPAQLSAAGEHPPTDASPQIEVSEFDYSVENHFKAVDKIAKLCGHPTAIDVNQPEIKRFSNSVIFLREWRDFNYGPRTLRFARQHDSKEKEVTGGVTLPQFSAASVPKKERQNGNEAGKESSKDFVMHVGGSIWALDWCPRVDRNSESHVKSEFVAVAAHPPESSYHKIGAHLTGRGAIQIWCLLTIYVKEDVPSQAGKKSRLNSQKKSAVKSNKQTKVPRPRGRPRKKPPNNSEELIDTDSQFVQHLAVALTKVPRPRGRPRKKPPNNSDEQIDTDSQVVQSLAVEYRMGSPTSHSPGRTAENCSDHVYHEDSVGTHKDSNQTECANSLLSTDPQGEDNKGRGGEKCQVQNNGFHILRQCEHGKSALVNQLASDSLDSIIPNESIASIGSCDDNNLKNSIPTDVALPRMMLCLAHNGKVAWDVKWRPVNGSDPKSMNMMGYLAVLLGNGALEVWEVPLPHTVKLVYPAHQECIDPRFIKLQPVFRCSMLKCGDRQSIPLTLEWSVSSPHDMILAGCHDGVVALWKFSVTDSFTETMPLLSFNADTGPIRTLAWAPIQSDLECANVIVTAGNKGFKFWDIRDPFRPLWDHHIPSMTYGLDWLLDPRCVFGSTEDGTLWLLSLERAVHDIPITGKCLATTSKHGFHSFDCSKFSIWSAQASRLTGMVAYCGEEGTTVCFQPTTRSVRDPSRNRSPHYLCGSLLEEESGLIVVSPSPDGPLAQRSPSMKRPGSAKESAKKTKEQLAICGNDPVEDHESNQAPKSKQSSKSRLKVDQKEIVEGDKKEEIEVFPPKIIAMHRVGWNVNKGSEKWLCYGGAAGLVRCQDVGSSVLP